MNSDFVSFRCPPDLLNALDAKAKIQGVTRSAFIIKVLQANLGLSSSNTNVIPTDSTTLDAYLLKRDALLLGKINNLEKRVADLESQVSQSKTEVTQANQPTPVISRTLISDTLKSGLTEQQLVERLNKKTTWIKANTLRQWAAQKTLAEVTQQHDPDNLAWQLVNGLYKPVI